MTYTQQARARDNWIRYARDHKAKKERPKEKEKNKKSNDGNHDENNVLRCIKKYLVVSLKMEKSHEPNKGINKT